MILKYIYIYKYYEILKYEKWYEHQPEPITEAKGSIILCEFDIQINDPKPYTSK